MFDLAGSFVNGFPIIFLAVFVVFSAFIFSKLTGWGLIEKFFLVIGISLIFVGFYIGQISFEERNVFDSAEFNFCSVHGGLKSSSGDTSSKGYVQNFGVCVDGTVFDCGRTVPFECVQLKTLVGKELK